MKVPEVPILPEVEVRTSRFGWNEADGDRFQVGGGFGPHLVPSVTQSSWLAPRILSRVGGRGEVNGKKRWRRMCRACGGWKGEFLFVCLLECGCGRWLGGCWKGMTLPKMKDGRG